MKNPPLLLSYHFPKAKESSISGNYFVLLIKRYFHIKNLGNNYNHNRTHGFKGVFVIL